jgi:hypothetical protein
VHLVASETHSRKVHLAMNLSTRHPGDGIEALNRLPGLAEPLLQIDSNESCSNCGEKTPGSGRLGEVPKPS